MPNGDSPAMLVISSGLHPARDLERLRDGHHDQARERESVTGRCFARPVRPPASAAKRLGFSCVSCPCTVIHAHCFPLLQLPPMRRHELSTTDPARAGWCYALQPAASLLGVLGDLLEPGRLAWRDRQRSCSGEPDQSWQSRRGLFTVAGQSALRVTCTWAVSAWHAFGGQNAIVTNAGSRLPDPQGKAMAAASTLANATEAAPQSSSTKAAGAGRTAVAIYAGE
jgi:hypothetical protein